MIMQDLLDYLEFLRNRFETEYVVLQFPQDHKIPEGFSRRLVREGIKHYIYPAKTEYQTGVLVCINTMLDNYIRFVNTAVSCAPVTIPNSCGHEYNFVHLEKGRPNFTPIPDFPLLHITPSLPSYQEIPEVGMAGGIERFAMDGQTILSKFRREGSFRGLEVNPDLSWVDPTNSAAILMDRLLGIRDDFKAFKASHEADKYRTPRKVEYVEQE